MRCVCGYVEYSIFHYICAFQALLHILLNLLLIYLVFVLLRQIAAGLCLYVYHVLQSVFVVNEWSNGCVIVLWLIFGPLVVMLHMYICELL